MDNIKTNTEQCSHCGKDMENSYTRYCERCYQELITQNANLQVELNNSISKELVQQLLEDLRFVLIQPQDPSYDAEMKLKHAGEIYMRYIPKIGIGGNKNESND